MVRMGKLRVAVVISLTSMVVGEGGSLAGARVTGRGAYERRCGTVDHLHLPYVAFRRVRGIGVGVARRAGCCCGFCGHRSARDCFPAERHTSGA